MSSVLSIPNMSGEQPIYSTKAHVFQIDPKTRRNWIPACPQPINVSYYFDSNRDTYRIISVDGSKAVINSTITPNMSFTKTSQKFGQWSDPKANTIYGLGFQSEAEIVKFMEKFSEVRELTLKIQERSESINANDNHSSTTTSTPSSVVMENSDSVRHQSPVYSLKNNHHVENDGDSSSNHSSSPASVRTNSPSNQNTITYSQLKFENERLKQALAVSSANAKKWEVELQTLKANNSKLSGALQESSNNVDDWKQQLASYKDECELLKRKVSQLESESASSSETSRLQRQVTDMTDRLHLQDRELKTKHQEMEDLRAKIDRLSTCDVQNQNLQEKIKILEKEKSDYKDSAAAHRLEMEEIRTKHDAGRTDLLKLQRQLTTKIQDLQVLQEQISSKLQAS